MPIFPKLQGCGSKIEPAMPLWISEFKRAWQAQFLSYNLETLEKWIFLKGVQIILLPFFHIPAGFKFRKNALKSDVHSLRRPWPIQEALNTWRGRLQYFLQLLYNQKIQKVILIWFVHLLKSNKFPEFHRCGSKNVPAAPIFILNFLRAWQSF